MENKEQLLPALDMTKLQQAANEAALKGAIREIEEYYTGYDSPFRKSIKKKLEEVGASIHLTLPDIVGLLNDALSKEITTIANNAIAHSYIPMVSENLCRAPKEEKFSEILEEFISKTRGEYSDYEDGSYECEVSEHDKYGWLDVRLAGKDNKQYNITLHWHNENECKKDTSVKRTYRILSLPRMDESSEKYKSRTMRLRNGNNELEMPFAPAVLQDEFAAYLAGMVLSQTIITMDITGIRSDMFPEPECHCD